MNLFFVIPGELEMRTGGYGYDRRMIAGLRARGWSVDVVPLDDDYPVPGEMSRARASAALAAIPDRATVLVDGLALGALPDEVERAATRLRIVALVHHPLADETGIEPALAAALEASERRALTFARRVAVTSRATAARLASFGVNRERIAVIEPGTDPAPLAICNLQSAIYDLQSEVSLLCVATVTPRKGHEILISALAAVPHANWRLTCAGSLDRDPATVARVRAQLRETGLAERVTFTGDLDAETLAAEYDRADLFVLPTLYEGYGMAVAEALARGLPVISTATGAIRDLVEGVVDEGLHDGVDNGVDEGSVRLHHDSDRAAGIVVPPGDLPAFTDALSRAIGDRDLRRELAAGARAVRDRLPTWEAATAAMARVLEQAAR